jgi:hypothetical protein
VLAIGDAHVVGFLCRAKSMWNFATDFTISHVVRQCPVHSAFPLARSKISTTRADAVVNM